MPSVYIHLAGEDIDEAQCILNGVTNAEKKEEQLKPKICQRCDERNPPGFKFCSKCGQPLDIQTAIEVDETRKKADTLMNELVKNPEVLDSLLKGIEKVKETDETV